MLFDAVTFLELTHATHWGSSLGTKRTKRENKTWKTDRERHVAGVGILRSCTAHTKSAKITQGDEYLWSFWRTKLRTQDIFQLNLPEKARKKSLARKTSYPGRFPAATWTFYRKKRTRLNQKYGERDITERFLQIHHEIIKLNKNTRTMWKTMMCTYNTLVLQEQQKIELLSAEVAQHGQNWFVHFLHKKSICACSRAKNGSGSPHGPTEYSIWREHVRAPPEAKTRRRNIFYSNIMNFKCGA